MVYHVLNGDALIEKFLATGIQGEIVVARECLIDGSLKGVTLADFWINRANYITQTYGEPSEAYFQRVVPEFDKLSNVSAEDEVHLWFEHDLYCQANLWFALSLLTSVNAKCWIVYPKVEIEAHFWQGFGASQPIHLQQAYNERIPFNTEDTTLGQNLWLAYKNNDLSQLKSLSHSNSECFPKLIEVCQAHLDRQPKAGSLSRPLEVLQSIIKELETNDFHKIFREFSKREGIYGLCDSQVRLLLEQL